MWQQAWFTKWGKVLPCIGSVEATGKHWVASLLAELLLPLLALALLPAVAFGQGALVGNELSILLPPRFACGPHLTTYLVEGPSSTRSDGVRCVKFGLRGAISWYGEGWWHVPDHTYRHVGEARFGTLGVRGRAADIVGNGEAAAGEARNLVLLLGPGIVPGIINVSGEWSETWVLVPSHTHPTYRSSLEHVATCGPHLRQYRAYDLTNAPGRGVRCFLPGGFTWYGEGWWDDRPYAHLGQETAAADICKPSLDACSIFADGALKFTPTNWLGIGAGFKVEGAWREMWLPSASRYAVRIQAVRVADDDGSNLTMITPGEVRKWVNFAQQVYAAADLDILFIQDANGPDFKDTFRHSALNHSCGVKRCGTKEDDLNWPKVQSDGNAFAAKYPDKIVVFFRGMAGGGGYSWWDYDFVVMPWFNTRYCADPMTGVEMYQNIGLLAHEMGHYLGLPHTFGEIFKTVDEAQAWYRNKGTSGFDGDLPLVSDTPPDPYIDAFKYQCKPTSSA